MACTSAALASVAMRVRTTPIVFSDFMVECKLPRLEVREETVTEVHDAGDVLEEFYLHRQREVDE